MSGDSAQRRRGVTPTQLATPLAVLALLAITAWLTLDARAAERSHRAAAENALRDYARFAAWQYSRHVVGHLRSHLMMNLAPARDLRLRPGAPLPNPRILAERAQQCDCGFKSDIVFAFRLDVTGGPLITDRAVAAPVVRRLALHLRPAMQRIADNGSAERRQADPEGVRDMLRQTSAIAFDTLGGQSFVLAYALVAEETGRARAVYGVATDPKHLRDDYERIVRSETLLPPSLVNGRPNDSLLSMRTVHPVTGPIFENSVPPAAGVPSHTDTLDAWLGGQITTVAIQPELASTLLIGGIPRSRLLLQLTLFAVAATLALVALVQVQRTRELGHLRERFVANVSHELRTPLAHISLLSETLMLGRERSEDERKHFATVVYREAGRLTTLVDSVLRFSRTQATSTRVTLERRDVAGEVHDAVAAFGWVARSSDVTIESRVAPNLVMQADPAAFRQILLNLFDNALKFGPHGQTVVVDASADNGAVAVSVTDQGRGIPERDRQRVFDAYTRLDHPGQPAVAGAGIGLSVVRGLVSAHGGTVWIETPPASTGTRVVFTVPHSA